MLAVDAGNTRLGNPARRVLSAGLHLDDADMEGSSVCPLHSARLGFDEAESSTPGDLSIDDGQHF